MPTEYDGFVDQVILTCFKPLARYGGMPTRGGSHRDVDGPRFQASREVRGYANCCGSRPRFGRRTGVSSLSRGMGVCQRNRIIHSISLPTGFKPLARYGGMPTFPNVPNPDVKALFQASREVRGCANQFSVCLIRDVNSRLMYTSDSRIDGYH